VLLAASETDVFSVAAMMDSVWQGNVNTSAMYPVSDVRKFGWSYTNRRYGKGIVKAVPWWRWTRILGARASATSCRGCSCHPSDSKSQSQVTMRSQQNCSYQEGDINGQNAQNVCGDLGNWRVNRRMDVLQRLHVHIPIPKKVISDPLDQWTFTIRYGPHYMKTIEILVT